MSEIRWWEKIPLTDMSEAQWESLCDGCAQCCLIQLEDGEGDRATTNVVCRHMDMSSCQCTRYTDRVEVVPQCLKLTPKNLQDIDWMPESCAYRLIRDGKPLEDWHPLVSGSKDTVHTSGNSVKGWVFSEDNVKEDDLELHIIRWH